MRAWTVQDLIDRLQRVEDKSRTVMVAGGCPFSGVEVLGTYEPSGHVIVWCAEKYAEKGRPGR